MKKIIKLLVLSLIIMLVYGIYYTFRSNKINYISLGDFISLDNSYPKYLKEYLEDNKKLGYYKNYSNSNNAISNLIDDIKYKNEIKRDLRESNIVTLSIGINDIFNNDKSNINNKIKNLILKLDICLKEIKKYAKNKIILVGFYNIDNKAINSIDEERIFAYIDDQYNEISRKYDITYIPIYEQYKKDNNPKYIFNKIICETNI